MIHTYCKDNIFVRSVKNAGAKGSIFYVHGLGESGLCFEKLMTEPKLAAWSHIAVDIPGYGKSPWTGEPLGFDEIINILSLRIQKNSIEPIILLGHSLGGALGTLLCEKYPELVKAFINVEGNISSADCTFSGRVAKYDLDEFVSSGFGKMLDLIYEAGVSDKALRGYYASFRMCDPRAYHKNSIELVEISQSETLAKRLAELKMPARYVLGNPRGIGDRSRDLLKKEGINYSVIENAGHWPYADQPDVFVAAVAEFLKTF